MQNYMQLALRAPLYSMFRKLQSPRLFPVNYTFSITNVCQSRCKTCFIWKLYLERPELRLKELSMSEWTQIFESLGKSLFWVTISGGEPYLRRDLVEICKTICEINKPRIINIPTNGLLSERIEIWTSKILEACAANGTELVVNLSLDGIESFHDEIRGVEGNWDASMKTLLALKELKERHRCLTVGIHTVISKYNFGTLPNIVEWLLDKLEPDHYIMEIAEERDELFNKDSDITPNSKELRSSLLKAARFLELRSKGIRGLSKISLAFRLRYYELLPKILESTKQLVPCMALFASCHISPYGDLWPCCILGYESTVGNLADYNYSFVKLWRSARADNIRKRIRRGICSCPLASASYTNLLLSPIELTRALFKLKRI